MPTNKEIAADVAIIIVGAFLFSVMVAKTLMGVGT